MNDKYNPKLIGYSQNLRRNMTKEEKHLWYDFLKKQPFTVHRQKVIGKYIVDFYIASFKTVIEIDGSQHYEESGIEKDTERDKFLENLEIKVLRYSNYDINTNFDGVCQDILKQLKQPSPQGEV